MMQKSGRFAFIGNALPRRCGIATFTTHLQQAVALARPGAVARIVAMNDHGRVYAYPPAVTMQVSDDRIADYEAAADALNAGAFDIVSLQHEFGIFGGVAGDHIMTLLPRLTMPVVTTVHTVLAEPSAAQRRALDRVVDASAIVVVMAEKARDLLQTIYHVPAAKIEVIPHGIPDVAFVDPEPAKAKLGFSGRAVILTFGLLSPNKGIEVMIDAMPAILSSQPDAVYVVLGATHPNLVREQGEAYRERLVERAHALGVGDRVVFLNQFVDQVTLLDFISMCDVYVTPYLDQAQITSGTLAYSFGLGRAVVSTPYWHARELLADGRGVLVPFGDAGSIGREIAGLLTDHDRREVMRRRAYASSRSMTWERTAQRYIAAFDRARHDRQRVVAAHRVSPTPAHATIPDMQTGYFLSMCDDTGLFQHAKHAVPDRSHGYCVDDNARALLVACALNGAAEQRLPEDVTTRFASFLQHAWNPDTQRFRNFMSFERRWLEERGSEDSHGRALWALGVCSRSDVSASRRRWAGALFAEAIRPIEALGSPRAWAFALLGLDAFCEAVPGDMQAMRIRRVLADRLMALLADVEATDWAWFEEGLSYDNARLPQALILTGLSTGVQGYVAAGLRALRWLVARQTAPAGYFRPVGSETFGDLRTAPRVFDQQPLEATATISACLAASRAAPRDDAWSAAAANAFAWFFGANELSTSLVDPETGSCRDGLHRDRANENRGGESLVCYLLSLAEMRQVAWLGRDRATRTASLRAI